MILRVKKLNPRAKLPAKAHSTDAGFDLFFLHDIEGDSSVLMGNEILKINTGIAIKLPEGYCGVIKDRSGNASKYGIHILAGLIDEAFVGHIQIVLYNTRKEAFIIPDGMKIAQMLILPVPVVNIVEVSELENTDRGSKGFGSSGLT